MSTHVTLTCSNAKQNPSTKWKTAPSGRTKPVLNEPWHVAWNILGYIVAGGLFVAGLALLITVLFAVLVWLRLPFLVRRINPARTARQAESTYANGWNATEYQIELVNAQRQAFIDGVKWARGEALTQAQKPKED